MISFFKYLLKILDFFSLLHNLFVFKAFNLNYKSFHINGKIFIRNKGEIEIGNNFRANSGKNRNPIGGDVKLRLICKKGGTITIGNNVGISNSTLVCWNSINIADNVLIGGGCKIWDTDFHSIDTHIRVHGKDNQVKSFPIVIKKNAFIGGGSIILKGVTIGQNSIIAAGSVVTRNIPANEIWGGNPIRFIKKVDNN